MKRKTIKTASTLIVLSSILTGCTNNTNNDETLSSVVSSENTVETSAVETSTIENIISPIQSLEGLSYNELYKKVSEGGKKLENLLKKFNIDHFKSTDNLSVYSTENTYQEYNVDYTKKIAYNYFMKADFTGNISFEMIKTGHRDDAISMDDGYFEIFYQTAKLYDSSLTKEELMQQIDELRLSDSDKTVVLYEDDYSTENELLKIAAYDTKIKLEINIQQPLTLEMPEPLTSEYATVTEFEQIKNNYSRDVNDYTDREMLSSSSLMPSTTISYSNTLEGDLSEEYVFDLSYLVDESKAESELTSERVEEMKIPQEIKDLMPKFIDIIKEHTNVNLVDYITTEQLLAEIDASLLCEALGGSRKTIIPLPTKNEYANNLTSSYLGDLSWSGLVDYPASNSISISILKNVTAEGKSRL